MKILIMDCFKDILKKKLEKEISRKIRELNLIVLEVYNRIIVK